MFASFACLDTLGCDWVIASLLLHVLVSVKVISSTSYLPLPHSIHNITEPVHTGWFLVWMSVSLSFLFAYAAMYSSNLLTHKLLLWNICGNILPLLNILTHKKEKPCSSLVYLIIRTGLHVLFVSTVFFTVSRYSFLQKNARHPQVQWCQKTG